MKELKILYQIKDLHKDITLYLHKDQNINKNHQPPTATQIRIINYILNKNEKVYQRDLEKNLNLTRATLSGVLKTMEKNGILKRTINTNDARSKEIIINEGIKEDFIKIKKRLYNAENLIIKDINKEEIDIFLKVLNKMKENINIELKEGNDTK